MSNSNGQTKPGKQGYGKVKWRGFVNVYLRKEHKSAIKQNLLSPTKCFHFLESAASAGLKISFVWSDKGQYWTTTAYCVDFRSANAGLSMSMRHGDFATSITALSYVLDMVGPKGKWEDEFGEVGEVYDW